MLSVIRCGSGLCRTGLRCFRLDHLRRFRLACRLHDLGALGGAERFGRRLPGCGRAHDLGRLGLLERRGTRLLRRCSGTRRGGRLPESRLRLTWLAERGLRLNRLPERGLRRDA
ncbi:hypothetical protein ABT279_27580, partial [Amycolatopsis sp. NPDC000673]|uniref:hypothetical protein n=1 Tax=Amycolatopsis sp. NPDC000673 TaxID=3154267 RepID=UPI0033185AF9